MAAVMIAMWIPLVLFALFAVGVPVAAAEIAARRHWRHRRFIAVLIPLVVVAVATVVMDLADAAPFDPLSDLRGYSAYVVGAGISLGAISYVFEQHLAGATAKRLIASSAAGLLSMAIAVPVQLYAACLLGAGCI